MNINRNRPICRDLWMAALHAKGQADARLTAQLSEAEKLLFAAARPKAVYKLMAKDDVKTKGFSIEKHLEGCHKVIVMAATLGIGVDNLLRKTQITDMAMAVMIDSGASVLIEQVCDDFEQQIKQRMLSSASSDGPELRPEYMTSRFSPGYGDYPLTEQSRIIGYLDAQRQIGLHVTADSLMIPGKSITALMGIADHPVTGRLATCNECVLKDKCTLRKEGKFCGD